MELHVSGWIMSTVKWLGARGKKQLVYLLKWKPSVMTRGMKYADATVIEPRGHDAVIPMKQRTSSSKLRRHFCNSSVALLKLRAFKMRHSGVSARSKQTTTTHYQATEHNAHFYILPLHAVSKQRGMPSACKQEEVLLAFSLRNREIHYRHILHYYILTKEFGQWG